MNSRHEAKMNMYRTVKQFCDDNNTTVASNAAFLAAFNNFKAKLASLSTAVASESQVISGITADKAALRRNLCTTAADIAALVSAYATANNNQVLKQSVNFRFSDLMRLKDELLAPNCQNIYAAANTNATALVNYGITAAMLTVFQTAITDYSAIVPKPRTAHSVRSTHTLNIGLLVREIDALLKEQLDQLIVAFKTTKPDFCASYKTARIIHDPITTTTQLKGKVMDRQSNISLSGATITMSGTANVSTTTNKFGHYLKKPLPAGEYTLTVSLPGYQDRVIEHVQIKLGQVNHQDILLQAM